MTPDCAEMLMKDLQRNDLPGPVTFRTSPVSRLNSSDDCSQSAPVPETHAKRHNSVQLAAFTSEVRVLLSLCSSSSGLKPNAGPLHRLARSREYVSFAAAQLYGYSGCF